MSLGPPRTSKAARAAKEVVERTTIALTAAVEESDSYLDGMLRDASDALTRQQVLQRLLLRAMSESDYVTCARVSMQISALARIVEVRMLCANERRRAVLESAAIIIQAGSAEPAAPRAKARMQVQRRARDDAWTARVQALKGVTKHRA